MNQLTDAYIIEKVLSGERQLFAHLVNRYSTMAFTIAYRILEHKHDAEEVVQDAFVKVFENLGSFRQKSSFSTWLYRIVYNTAISRIRSRKNEEMSIDNKMMQIEDESIYGNFLYGYTEEEASLLVQKALALLPEDERTIVTLFYLNESKIDEIHKITGLSKSNVKIKLFRARKKLMLFFKKFAEINYTVYTINMQ
jgi:RNA polymerase sigma-70 factor (ECF subfamily)